ncbi:MAG TPA: Uma2 family endonuclease [Kofleriaceae bacterium]|nr:Uma2 family endonuclease [Kofleriaceae bacterium]
MTLIDVEAIAPGQIRGLKRREFDQLVKLGAFDDERVELLFGTVVTMGPPDPAHDESINTIDELLKTQLRGRARVRVQSCFAASDDSEPLPDILVVPPARYWDEHPSRAHLVAEVAKSSLRKDQGIKARLYGSVAVEEYWIVDLEAGGVHVLRDADGNGEWRTRRFARRGEVLRLVAFPDVELAVAQILPPV